MNDPFVHLHVASGYSMRYGANHPADLVARAAEHGMTALALTDRDGLYGAVKFALACRSAGVRPIFGVDLAVAPAVDTAVPPALARRSAAPRPGPSRHGCGRRAGRRAPARGGASVDPRLPRVTFLARDGAGWRSLCRLTSATHLRGTRGEPVSSLAMAAEHASGLIALLGPDSSVGRALLTGRADLAVAHLDAWRAAFGPGRLVLEVVHHRGQGDRSRAQAMLRFAAEHGVPVVLSNAVRYVDALDAPTADVLDAARRLVPLGRAARRPAHRRGLPEVGQGDGRGRRGARRSRPRRRPAAARAHRPAGRAVRGRRPGRPRHRQRPLSRARRRHHGRRARAGPLAGAAGPVRGGDGPPRHGAVGAGAAAAGRGAGGDRLAGLPVLLPHRRRRGRPHQELEGSGGGPGLGCRQPGHLPAGHLRRRPAALRPADGALPLPAARPAARHRHRRGVRPADGGLRRGDRPLRRRPGQLHLDDGHLPGAARHPRRRGRARPAAGGDRRRRQGLSAHPGQPGARRAARPAGAAGQPAGLEARPAARAIST